MKKKETRTDIFCSALLWLLSLTVFLPLLMIVFTSFKDKKEGATLNLVLPAKWMWENYVQVLKTGNVLRALGNSVFVSAVTLVIVLITASMLGYMIARLNTRGSRFVDWLVGLGIIVPFSAMPTMMLLQSMKIYGGVWGLICVYSALYLPFSTMIITSYIRGLPRELDEAAVIDGATGMCLFVRIIVPLLKPIAATAAVVIFMWSWNELQVPLYLLNSSSSYTLPMSVFSFYGAYNKWWNLVCADVVLVTLPVVLVYVFAQKFVISGMTAGAVKM